MSFNLRKDGCRYASLDPRTEFMWCQKRDGHEVPCDFGKRRKLLIDVLEEAKGIKCGE